MKSFLVFLLVVSCFGLNRAAFWKNCGSFQGKLENVEIEGCKDNKCVLHKNSNVSMAITFTPNQDIEQLNTNAKMLFLGIGIDITNRIGNGDPCQNNGLQCPLKGQQSVTYKVTANIPNVPLPAIPGLNIIWRLLNAKEKDKTIVCVDITFDLRS